MSRARQTSDIPSTFGSVISGLRIARASATTFTVSEGVASNQDGPITFLMQRSAASTKSLSAFAVGGGGASARSNVMLSTVPSNTNGRVRSRLNVSGASDQVICTTFGWIDPRGA